MTHPYLTIDQQRAEYLTIVRLYANRIKRMSGGKDDQLTKLEKKLDSMRIIDVGYLDNDYVEYVWTEANRCHYEIDIFTIHEMRELIRIVSWFKVMSPCHSIARLTTNGTEMEYSGSDKIRKHLYTEHFRALNHYFD